MPGVGSKYNRRGIMLVKFTPTITDVVAPFSVTRLEITGAVLLTKIQNLDGLTFENQPIDASDLDSTFGTTVPGGDTVQAPVLTFHEPYDIPANQTVRTALAKGNTGYLLVFPYGDVPTYEMEIWKVESTGCNRLYSADNETAKFRCGFAVPVPPTQNAIVPA